MLLAGSKILGFLVGPIGRWLLIAGALFIWHVHKVDQARDEARAECQAETIRRTLQEVIRQRDAAKLALEAQRKQAEISRKEIAELEKENVAIVESLGESSADSCVVPDDIRRRLQNIR